jgi:ribosome-associated toxin RatA of RatAB toxin-antitoxin module
VRRIRRSVLVPHGAGAMYRLVNDVGAYPEFLPWCRAATVHVETDALMEATLELSSKGLNKAFTTRNVLTPNQKIEIGLVDGPFSVLAGGWTFDPLDEHATEVSLALSFAFRNPVNGLLFGPMFEDIATSLVDAFSRRARSVYLTAGRGGADDGG